MLLPKNAMRNVPCRGTNNLERKQPNAHTLTYTPAAHSTPFASMTQARRLLYSFFSSHIEIGATLAFDLVVLVGGSKYGRKQSVDT